MRRLSRWRRFGNISPAARRSRRDLHRRSVAQPPGRPGARPRRAPRGYRRRNAPHRRRHRDDAIRARPGAAPRRRDADRGRGLPHVVRRRFAEGSRPTTDGASAGLGRARRSRASVIDLHTQSFRDRRRREDMDDAVQFARVAVTTARPPSSTPHYWTGSTSTRADVLAGVAAPAPGSRRRVAIEIRPAPRSASARTSQRGRTGMSTLADNGRTVLFELSMSQYPVELENLIFQMRLPACKCWSRTPNGSASRRTSGATEAVPRPRSARSPGSIRHVRRGDRGARRNWSASARARPGVGCPQHAGTSPRMSDRPSMDRRSSATSSRRAWRPTSHAPSSKGATRSRRPLRSPLLEVVFSRWSGRTSEVGSDRRVQVLAPRNADSARCHSATASGLGQPISRAPRSFIARPSSLMVSVAVGRLGMGEVFDQ